MNHPNKPGIFYQFLGAHSLLIGLLPFFLPVYLWQHGLDLAGLSLLLGASGLSFAAVLGLWQLVSRRWSISKLITLTFILEIVLVATVGLFTTVPGAALFTPPGGEIQISTVNLILTSFSIGIANGLYNAFFWTTQRTLFLQQLGTNDAGRKYGNFQIFVTLFLKVGILLGGLLLEQGGFVWLLALSAGIGFAATQYLASKAPSSTLHTSATITLKQSLRHRDERGSRPIFMIDGLFLYLESHFWTLSLFIVVKQDFSRLGAAVVALALVFAVLFFLIKNRIDQLAVERVYKSAVWLYAASWLLRFTTDDTSTGPSLLAALIVITFFSSFFRLAFNKRFFDVARTSGAIQYLLIKSYSSQAYLGACFLLFGAVLLVIPSAHVQVLQYLYLPASVLSLVYLSYRDRSQTT